MEKWNRDTSEHFEIENEYNNDRYSKFGLVFRENGDWTGAENLDIQVMKTRNEVFGQEHPDTFISMGNLALTYLNQRRWNEAEQLEILHSYGCEKESAWAGVSRYLDKHGQSSINILESGKME